MNPEPSFSSRPRLSWKAVRTLFLLLLFLVTWVIGWTGIFSAIDFWTIKLRSVEHWRYFFQYRGVMANIVAWVSPPSFGLAENAYFYWLNSFDPHYQMHEWAWYSGNPVNPDGDYNFVWGDGKGNWVKYPMVDWYARWGIQTLVWLGLVAFIYRRRRGVSNSGAEMLAAARDGLGIDLLPPPMLNSK